MSLTGKGFLAIWNGIQAEGDREFQLWHAVNHMPERIVIPGINIARRYIADQETKYTYFTLYEAEEPGVFMSSGYRNASPTGALDRKVRANFLNFERAVCDCIASSGEGVAGWLATVGLTASPALKIDNTAAAERLISEIREQDGVTGASIGIIDRATTTGPKFTLPPLPVVPDFDGVLMIEGIGGGMLRDAIDALPVLIGGIFPGSKVVSPLVYVLQQYLPAKGNPG
jgi:hypothetical protein